MMWHRNWWGCLGFGHYQKTMNACYLGVRWAWHGKPSFLWVELGSARACSKFTFQRRSPPSVHVTSQADAPQVEPAGGSLSHSGKRPKKCLNKAPKPAYYSKLCPNATSGHNCHAGKLLAHDDKTFVMRVAKHPLTSSVQRHFGAQTPPPELPHVHLGPLPITVDRTSKPGTVENVSLDFCRSIMDYVFPSFCTLERSGCSAEEQIWKITKNSLYLHEVLQNRVCGTSVRCNSSFHGA
jgi:hypothetical protein